MTAAKRLSEAVSESRRLLAIAVERSANEKTGPVSVTYASIDATCPKSCPLKDSGCYAQAGMVGIHERRTDKARRPIDAARAEARAVDSLSGEHPLRLHVSGDARTEESARTLASAAAFHTNKAGKPVWTYTHAWRDVSRAAWGGVSVLASVHSTAEARDAMSRGYAPAMIVPEHTSHKAETTDGVRMIPCPAQTKDGVRCVDCKLCWNDRGLLARGSAIAFAAHGSSHKRAASTCA